MTSTLGEYDPAAVAARVRALRERWGLTRADLAERAQVKPGTIRKLETATASPYVPSAAVATAIATAFAELPEAVFGELSQCLCGCGALTLRGTYAQGHGPKHAGPVLARRDRVETNTMGGRM